MPEEITDEILPPDSADGAPAESVPSGVTSIIPDTSQSTVISNPARLLSVRSINPEIKTEPVVIEELKESAQIPENASDSSSKADETERTKTRAELAQEVIDKYTPQYNQAIAIANELDPKVREAKLLDLFFDGTETDKKAALRKLRKIHEDVVRAYQPFSSNPPSEHDPEYRIQERLRDIGGTLSSYINELKPSNGSSPVLDKWIEGRIADREKMEAVAKEAAIKNQGIEVVEGELERTKAKGGYSSVRHDAGVVDSVLREFYSGKGIEPDQKYKSDVLEGIFNPEVRDAVDSLWEASIRKIVQEVKEKRLAFDRFLSTTTANLKPSEFYVFLDNYSKGLDERGNPLRFRDRTQEYFATRLRSRIDALRDSVDSAEYESLREVITPDAINKKIIADFGKDSLYGGKIAGYLTECRVTALDKAATQKALEKFVDLPDQSMESFMTVAAGFYSEAPGLWTVNNRVLQIMSNIEITLSGRKLSELDDPLQIDLQSAIGKGLNPALVSFIGTYINAWVEAKQNAAVGKIRAEFEVARGKIKDKLQSELDRNTEAFFSDNSGVRLRYGEHWEMARDIYRREQEKNISLYIEQIGVDSLTHAQLQELYPNEGTQFIRGRSDQAVEKVRSRIGSYYSPTIETGIYRFSGESTRKVSPDMVVQMADGVSDRPGWSWTSERRVAEWSGLISGVILERIRNSKTESANSRTALIAKQLGAAHSHYLHKPDPKFVDDYEKAMEAARKHLLEVGFSDSEVRQFSADMFITPQQERIIEVADKYIYDELGHASVMSKDDIKDMTEYYLYSPDRMIAVARDNWVEPNPAKRAEMFDDLFSESLRGLEMQRFYQRIKTDNNFEPFDDWMRFEVPISDLIADTEIPLLRAEMIREGSTAKTFKKLMLQLMQEHNEKLVLKIEEINRFAGEFLAKSFQNPGELESLGINVDDIDAVDWVNLTITAIRARFASVREERLKVRRVRKRNLGDGRPTSTKLDDAKLIPVFDHYASRKESVPV